MPIGATRPQPRQYDDNDMHYEHYQECLESVYRAAAAAVGEEAISDPLLRHNVDALRSQDEFVLLSLMVLARLRHRNVQLVFAAKVGQRIAAFTLAQPPPLTARAKKTIMQLRTALGIKRARGFWEKFTCPVRATLCCPVRASLSFH